MAYNAYQSSLPWAGPAAGQVGLGSAGTSTGGHDPWANPLNPNARFDMTTAYNPYGINDGPSGGGAPSSGGMPNQSAEVRAAQGLPPLPAGPGAATGGNQWFGGLGSQYQQLLGREMDQSGRDYWSNLDSTTNLTDDQLQTQFMQGVRAELGGGSQPSGGGYGNYSSNPYQTGVSNDIQRRVQEMLGQSFAGIRSGAVGAGGVGGGREGVAQGIAATGAADSLAGNLANMNSANWNADQGRALTDQGQMLTFYNQGRQLDQSGMDLGMKGLTLAQSGAWGPVAGMTGATQPWSGQGTTTTNSQSGGGWQGALGGAIGGATMGRNMGWW